MIFAYNQLKYTFEEQSEKIEMLLKRMVPHVPKTIPQDDSQRVFEDNHAHLYVRALVHLQDDINTDKMEKEPSFSAQEITNTTLVIRVQREILLVHLFIHTFVQQTLARQLFCSRHCAKY